jgi:hypothetical protein
MKISFRELQEKYGEVCLMCDIVPLHYIDRWGADFEVSLTDTFDIYDYDDLVDVLKVKGVNLNELKFSFKDLYVINNFRIKERLEELLYDAVYDGDIDFELDLNVEFVELLYKNSGYIKRGFVHYAINQFSGDVVFEAAQYLKVDNIDDFNSIVNISYEDWWHIKSSVVDRISGFLNSRMFEAILQMIKRDMELE